MLTPAELLSAKQVAPMLGLVGREVPHGPPQKYLLRGLQLRITYGTVEPSTQQPESSMFQLQAATLAARAKTGDKHIGTQVAQGRIDVVRAVPPASGRGRYTVTVLAGGLSLADAVAYLGRMQ